MPENGWGMAYLFSLAADEAGHDELRSYCVVAGVDFQDALRESLERPDVAAYGVRERISEEVFPVLTTVLRQFRQQPNYQRYVVDRMTLGTAWMEELGNLYTGALPAWLAAGLEEAASQGAVKADKEILMVGYGSGDAAEAIPIKLVPGWQQAAEKIDMHGTMANPVNLTHEQYLTLRDGSPTGPPPYTPKAEFIVDRVGLESETGFQDAGIEYYRFIQ
jgi:hydroxymethylglutaryl-CoA synthase